MNSTELVEYYRKVTPQGDMGAKEHWQGKLPNKALRSMRNRYNRWRDVGPFFITHKVFHVIRAWWVL